MEIEEIDNEHVNLKLSYGELYKISDAFTTGNATAGNITKVAINTVNNLR
jgi:hypothetical protein